MPEPWESTSGQTSGSPICLSPETKCRSTSPLSLQRSMPTTLISPTSALPPRKPLPCCRKSRKWISKPNGFAIRELLTKILLLLMVFLECNPSLLLEKIFQGWPGIKEAHQRWHPYDSHTLSYVEGWATTQVISEALRRSLQEQGFSRERVKLALEGFKDFITGGLTPPLTITSKDHRPSVESRIFIIKDGKLSRHTGFISLGR